MERTCSDLRFGSFHGTLRVLLRLLPMVGYRSCSIAMFLIGCAAQPNAQGLVKQDLMLDLLFELPLDTELDALQPFFPQDSLFATRVSRSNSHILKEFVLFDRDTAQAEFSYHQGKLVSHGAWKRALNEGTARFALDAVTAFITARIGAPAEIINDSISHDVQHAVYSSRSWEWNGNLIGVSITDTYDGHVLAWGKQSISPLRIVYPEKKPVLPEAWPVGVLNDTSVASDHGRGRSKMLEIPLRGADGTRVGHVELEYLDRGNIGPTVLGRLRLGPDTIRLERSEFMQHRYAQLYVYGVMGDRYLIVQRTVEDSLFVHARDLPASLVFSTLLDHQIRQESYMYHRYGGIGLYSEPDMSSQALLRLDEGMHRVKHFTGRTEGAWAEVVMYEMKDPGLVFIPCYSEARMIEHWTGEQWTGWVRVLDEHGQVEHFEVMDGC